MCVPWFWVFWVYYFFFLFFFFNYFHFVLNGCTCFGRTFFFNIYIYFKLRISGFRVFLCHFPLFLSFYFSWYFTWFLGVFNIIFLISLSFLAISLFKINSVLFVILFFSFLPLCFFVFHGLISWFCVFSLVAFSCHLSLFIGILVLLVIPSFPSLLIFFNGISLDFVLLCACFSLLSFFIIIWLISSVFIYYFPLFPSLFISSHDILDNLRMLLDIVFLLSFSLSIFMVL